MKKINFYKTMQGTNGKPDIRSATGYQQFYTIAGTDIELSLVFEKCAYDWSITEEKSGFLVNRNFRTRKEAEQSITPELIKAIADKLPGLNYYITLVNIERGKREDQKQ